MSETLRGKNGGARPGSGRKSLRDKFAPKIATTEKAFADYLKEAAENLQRIASSSERIEEEWALAGTVLIDGPLLYPNGEPMIGPNGKALAGKVPAFPNMKPETLVLVKRKVVTLPPDREANIYIVDRIIGKPITAVEAEVTGTDGGPINLAFKDSLSRVWGEPELRGESVDSDLTGA